MNFARACAATLGGIIVILGILGFFDSVTPSGFLLGIFEVNTFHNFVHILSGSIGIIAAIPGYRRYASWYILTMGVVYGLLTFLGFTLDGDFFNLAVFNLADNLLHAGITTVSFLMAIFILIDWPEQFTGISLQNNSR